MKNHLRAVLLITAMLSFSSHFAAAGGAHVSGGGTGVKIGSDVFLLDLVEAGIQSRVTVTPKNLLLEASLESLTWLSSNERQILASKLDLLYRIDPVLGTAAIKAMLYYRWVIIPEDLTPLPVDQPVLTDADFVQIAVRKTLQIYVSQNAWKQMSANNHAALVLHEALSSLLPPSEPAIWARQLTASLFSIKGFADLPPLLKAEIRQSWPSEGTLTPPANLAGIDGFDIVTLHTIDQYGKMSTNWDATIYPYVTSGNQTISPADGFTQPSSIESLCAATITNGQPIELRAFNLTLNRLVGDSSVEPHLQGSLSLEPDLDFTSVRTGIAGSNASSDSATACEQQLKPKLKFWAGILSYN